jgi:AMP-polyphosphate phosphotransferase
MSLLDKLDLTQKLASKEEYRKKLHKLQLRLLRHQRRILESKRNIIIVLEGPDAAGKGGIIKRITEKLDPRMVRVYPIAKPSQEEYHHHYLWRFWTRMPTYGEVAIFDRSWYGRVLVERVEEFAKPHEWKRAYREINEFERQLTDAGSLVLKFYIQISKKEQLKRFKERQSDPYKHWKINSEDWRNRRKWDEYLKAAEDMIKKTASKKAPWRLISGEYKWHARLAVIKHIVKEFDAIFNGKHRA